MMKDLPLLLGGCKFSDQCKCEIPEPVQFTSNEIFGVFDEGCNGIPVKIVTLNADYQLTVKNPYQRTIGLGKLDNCIIEHCFSKCDCVIFSLDRTYFVEIKTSALGSRNNKRQKAYKQLDTTLNYFKEKKVYFDPKKTSAVICFKSLEPRIINSANNTAKAMFLELHGIMLEEKNVIEFV